MTASDLSANAKALLLEGRQSLRPSAVDKERIYAALQARLALSGELQEVQAPVSSLSGAVFGKAIVGAIVFLAAVGAVYFLQSPKVSDVALVTPSVGAASGIEVHPQAGESALSSVAGEPSGPAVAAASIPRTANPPSDRLGEEAALLLRAEKEFHAGRLANSLRLVEEHARKFPSGVLKRERLKLQDGVLCGLAAARRVEGTKHEVVGVDADRKLAQSSPCSR